VTRAGRYLEALRALPQFRHCSTRRLLAIAKLADTIELPAGTRVHTSDREVVLTTEAVRAVVVDRRALPELRELAPGFADDMRVSLVRRSSDGRCPR
jgi:hypothetical protein